MVSSGGLELLWFMKQMHPDAEVRSAVAAVVSGWVEASAAVRLRSDVRDLVVKERGTALEPFVLEDADIDDVCDLAVLAFEASRPLIVVSRDKLEPLGGLLLTARPDDEGGLSLESRYVERQAAAGSRAAPKRTWRYAPGLRPTDADTRRELPRLRATAGLDESGYWIRVGPFPRTPNVYVARGSIRLLDGPAAIGIPHWRMEESRVADGHEVSISPAAPEDAIQLSALMVRNQWFTVRTETAAPAMESIAIRLAVPPKEGESVLTTVPILGRPVFEQLERWLLADNVPDLANRVGGDRLVDLGNWLGLAPGWEEPHLLEQFV